MSAEKKVAYYNMPNGLSYERDLLEKWEIRGLSLEEVRGSCPVRDLKGFQGLVTEYTILGESVFSKLPDLQIIALQSIGYDEIDTEAARRHGIDVTNTPGYCSEEVATHAMALLLSVERQIPYFDRMTKSGRWDPYGGSPMHRLSGKTAGLVSFGHIAKALVPMLQGFGIRVQVFSHGKSDDRIREAGAVKVSTLQELFETSDIISLHCPLTDSTRHMVSRELLDHSRPGQVLINTARGALIDEEALCEALSSGRIAAAGLDVLEDEKNRTSPLLKMPNVVVTPHAAFLSEESLLQCRSMALRMLADRLVYGKRPEYTVN